MKYKHDRKLFRQYTHNAEETQLNELQFADDSPPENNPNWC